jgi:pilus assembly protein TadC
MPGQAVAALLLASALVMDPSHLVSRVRLAGIVGAAEDKGASSAGLPVSAEKLLPVLAAASLGLLTNVLCRGLTGILAGAVVAMVTFFATRKLLNSAQRAKCATTEADALRLAASWDLLAACLRSGMPVVTAIRAVAVGMPNTAGRALSKTAELLSLGADPVAAWAPALSHPATAALARGARRTARSGAALANVANSLATALRSSAADLAQARAQRAGVHVTGPLGLCFLPAFLCLGVVPVVIGLASKLLAHW